MKGLESKVNLYVDYFKDELESIDRELAKETARILEAVSRDDK